MSNGRFLLVAMRDGDAVARAEYLDFLGASGLAEDQLDHFRIIDESSRLPNLSLYDGVFVGGSPFNVTDWDHCTVQKHAHALLSTILHSPTPSFYTCFGASFTAFCLGGRVDRTHGEVAGTSTVRLTDAATDDPLLSSFPAEFLALTGHKESVAELPAGAVLLASGPTCPVQLYRVFGNNWVSQFHPEMNAEGLLQRMSFYVGRGYFEAEEYEEIARRVRAADLSTVARLIPAFVEYCQVQKEPA